MANYIVQMKDSSGNMYYPTIADECKLFYGSIGGSYLHYGSTYETIVTNKLYRGTFNIQTSNYLHFLYLQTVPGSIGMQAVTDLQDTSIFRTGSHAVSTNKYFYGYYFLSNSTISFHTSYPNAAFDYFC